MSDNIAVLDGFTREIYAHCSNGLNDLYLMVQPNADLDGTFRAWDMDGQEFIRVNGWLFTIEEIATH